MTHWPTILWSMVAAACLTLALVHVLACIRQSCDWAHLLFSCSAISAAGMAGYELAMMTASSPEEIGGLIRWSHPVVFLLIASLICFVRLYLDAGRMWLAMSILGLRGVSLVVNFIHEPNLNYARITGIRHVEILGSPVSVAVGEGSLWMLLVQCSSVLFVVFLLDVMRTVWRRGDRQRAITICGSMILFITIASTQSALVQWGVIQQPYVISMAYMGIMVAMSYELSSNVVRAGTLSRQLQAHERALRDSEGRFRQVADSAPVMIWVTDANKLCTFLNKRWTDFTGRTLEQDLGNGWAEGIHPEDHQRALDMYVGACDRRQEFALEYRLRDARGEYRWVLDHGIPNYASDGTFVGYIGSVIDITERKIAEDRFRQVVEAAPSAMIMINPEGIIALVNAQVETVFGYSRDELVGQSIELVVPEAPRGTQARKSFQSPDARATGVGRELFGRRKDGSRFPIELGLSPVTTGQGAFTLASIVDVTSRRLAELEAQIQRDELAHLSRVAMLGELSGSLAHELNQPLTAILSNAEAAQQLLLRGPEQLDEVREILDDIVKDDSRAGEIIQRLRLLHKKGELKHQALDVNETVREVMKLANSSVVNQNVTMRAQLEEGLPAMSADRVQMQQVLLNLIMNACDAMAHTQNGDRHLTLRTASANGDGIEIRVIDRGTGIPPENLERVFEPFFSTKPHGLGLGLSVCRTIVSAHAGKLWATNNPDCGASFHLTLPAAPAERNE